MTVAVKNDSKAPLVGSAALPREAGFKDGQDLELRATDAVFTITPKLTPHEIEDEREIRDPKVHATH